MPPPESDRGDGPTRRRVLAAGSTGLAGALAGCGALPFAGEEPDPDVLRFALPMPPRTLDPLARQDPAAALVVRQVAEGLYRYDRDMAIRPLLASGPPEVTRTGLRWVVEISPEATFDGGKPVTAEAVQHSFRTARQRGRGGVAHLDMVERVSRIDDRTVQFDLAYPYDAFELSLMAPIVPVPEDASPNAPAGSPTGASADPAADLVGSGPFAVDRSTTEGPLRLVARSDYWRQAGPGVDAIEFPVIPEDTKRIVTLKAQEIGATQHVPPAVWETLDGLEDVSMTHTDGYGYSYLAFNCNAGPTTDPDVRTAIEHAIDVDTVVEEAVGPSGVPIAGPLPAPIAEAWSFPTDTWASMRRSRDIDRARRLLEDSDAISPDWELRLIVPPDESRETICEAVAEGIREAGYAATVQRLDWPTFRETYTTGDPSDYHVYCLSQIAGTDPDGLLYPLFGPGAAGQTEGTYYEGATEAVARGRRRTDRQDRRAAYEDAAAAILGDTAHIPLFTRRQSVAKRATVRDVAPHPTEGAVLSGEGISVAIDDSA
jgi:peptide/nickel transport system substrate-binding protein